MGIAIWPVGLKHNPTANGYKWKPHPPQKRTSMEQGVARKRRLWTDAPATISVSWPFSLSEFEIFRSWHHVVLEDGALFFNMPVWTGASYTTCLCRFSGDYKPVLQGGTWTVTADIEVRGVPYLTVGENPTIGGRAWPASLEPRTMRDGFTMVPNRPVVKTDIENAPVTTKRWFEDGPATPTQQWLFSGDEFELFRAWYHSGLRDGVSWFTLPAWVGGDFGTRRARFVDSWEATLTGDYWLVRADIEIRDVPYLADLRIYAEGVIGIDAYEAFGNDLHHFVHVTYPGAMP